MASHSRCVYLAFQETIRLAVEPLTAAACAPIVSTTASASSARKMSCIGPAESIWPSSGRLALIFDSSLLSSILAFYRGAPIRMTAPMATSRS